MNKMYKVYYVIIGIIVFLAFNKSILVLIGNISTYMRPDNKIELEKNVYQERIEYLEKTLSEYENNLNNLKILPREAFVLSKISIRNIYDFYDYLVINTDTKVNKGNSVINENGFVGLVQESDDKIAKVSLLTGLDNVSVKVGETYGILSGYDNNKKLFKVTSISNYNKVNIGDEVITSGLSSVPGMLKIGKVENIEEKGIEKIVYIKSDVNFDELNYLYVIVE